MVKIPDSLHSLFSATVEKRNDAYVIKIPPEEVLNNTITPNGSYRIGVFTQVPSSTTSIEHRGLQNQHLHSTTSKSASSLPVEEGEILEVEIESLGDQGDGIAKVKYGYVVIVPDTRPGDEVTIEIKKTQENVAFATVIADDQ